MTSKFLTWLISKQKILKKNKCKQWKKNGAGVLVFCSETKRFLVHCRGKAGSNAGQYGLFGGSLDIGKNEAKKIKSLEELASDDAMKIFEKTAIRELYEESGYSGEIDLKLISIHRDVDCKFQFYNFLGVVDEEFEVDPPKEFLDETEVKKCQWLTWQELKNLQPKHFGLKKIIKKGWENPTFLI
jgi:8-oxo-dGTP pyrophosphatase MutT (NUDIX family)